jgi:hypothetical protein
VAALELLIGHRRWLRRADFIDGFVELGPGLVGETVIAVVDWAAAIEALEAGRLPCSSSEGAVLGIAASLADDIPVDLGAALSGLDATNLGLVAAAVMRAGGRGSNGSDLGWVRT